ncbi:MAG: hypothetical protein II547_10340, partial [Treponema sp.]|nr:hypothetical protein [Treponema sp.]
NDFQNNGGVYITTIPNESDVRESRVTPITKNNFMIISMYLAVRHCIEQSWLNDHDQFLYPSDGWQKDHEFQGDCLIYTLFHGQNRISVTSTSLSDHTVGERSRTNHWIPFTEQQVGCKKAFKSTFMADFIKAFLAGKIDVSATPQHNDGLFAQETALPPSNSCGNFSPEAKAVYDAGLELWKYYHSKRNANPDASFYDIRKFFQGESKGRMNTISDDETYTELIGDLRAKQKVLAKKIEVCVYKYGFLK